MSINLNVFSLFTTLLFDSLSFYCSIKKLERKNSGHVIKKSASYILLTHSLGVYLTRKTDMEGDHHKVETANGSNESSTPASSRWNPTKDQISLLESLYMQGIRTPSAEQIQQITARLRAFGHIEGKNVFYWFQNHKARQRQKQKQENIAYFNRLIHLSQSLPALPTPPCPFPNVLCCSPCYLPHNDMGVCPPYPKLLLPSTAVRRKQRVADMIYEKPRNSSDGRHGHEQLHLQGEKTLPLFPLHPTGVLQGREMGQVFNVNTAASTSTTSNAVARSSYQIDQETASAHFAEQNFIDFFSL